MKIIRILIAFSLLFSVLPLEAFCHDHHDAMEHDHCVLTCHTNCFHAIILDKPSLQYSCPLAEISISSVDLSYQNPFIDTFKRPPVEFS